MLHASLMIAGGLDYALRQSSWPGILIVVALLLVSSLSWAVMVTKYRALRRATTASREFLTAWRASAMPLEIYAKGQRFEFSPHYRIYHEGSRSLTQQLLGDATVDETLGERLLEGDRLVPAQMETVQLTMQKASGEASLNLEAQTSLLATAVSGAPFLGLLGTVWGVMDTFSGIAESTSAASVKDMAPGVAAALVTTVVGLLVAIPAMFGYNWLVNQVRRFAMSLENFTAELAASFNGIWLDPGVPTLRPAPIRPGMIANLARPKMSASAADVAPAPLPFAPPEKSPAERLRDQPADPEAGASED
jgi:biopolymer transport protein TolQ